jgi:hypothetical protein
MGEEEVSAGTAVLGVQDDGHDTRDEEEGGENMSGGGGDDEARLNLARRCCERLRVANKVDTLGGDGEVSGLDYTVLAMCGRDEKGERAHT